MSAPAAGLAYAALAFLIGALLGPLRELVLAPRIGGLPAALAEAAVMAGLILGAARFVMARVAPPLTPRARAMVAGIALVLVLGLEAMLGMALAASGLAALRAPRGMAEQAVGLPLLGWLAALPFLLRRHARALP